MSTTQLRPVFAANLRRLMTERSMGQQELAMQLGVALRTISGWCRGETYPRPRALRELAQVFETTPAQLNADPEQEA